MVAGGSRASVSKPSEGQQGEQAAQCWSSVRTRRSRAVAVDLIYRIWDHAPVISEEVMLCRARKIRSTDPIPFVSGLHHAYRSITRTADLAPPPHRLHAHAPASGHPSRLAHRRTHLLAHFRTTSAVHTASSRRGTSFLYRAPMMHSAHDAPDVPPTDPCSL